MRHLNKKLGRIFKKLARKFKISKIVFKIEDFQKKCEKFLNNFKIVTIPIPKAIQNWISRLLLLVNHVFNLKVCVFFFYNSLNLKFNKWGMYEGNWRLILKNTTNFRFWKKFFKCITTDAMHLTSSI